VEFGDVMRDADATGGAFPADGFVLGHDEPVQLPPDRLAQRRHAADLLIEGICGHAAPPVESNVEANIR
jgi:hypothetical protein